MSETITFNALDLAGETGLKLYLRKNDGTLLNTGGDAFSDLGSAGVFTATLDESRVGLGTLHARICDGTETADNSLYEEFLPESETVIGASGVAVLNSTTLNAIADAVLARDWEAVTGDVPSRSVLNALRHIRNKWALDGATKTVYAEDGTTPAFTTTVTADGAGNITADTPND